MKAFVEIGGRRAGKSLRQAVQVDRLLRGGRVVADAQGNRIVGVTLHPERRMLEGAPADRTVSEGVQT